MAEEANNTSTTATEGTENAGATQETNQNTNTTTETVRTFTQAEVDAMIEKRLARERKKSQQNTANTATEEQTTAATETGTTHVEVDVTEDARQQAAAIIAQANQRLIQAIAQSEATKLNINPSYIADAVRLADLSKVTVNNDGTVDTKSITAALEAVIERMPVLKATTESPAGGFKVGGQGGNSQTNGWNNNASKTPGETKRWNKNRY